MKGKKTRLLCVTSILQFIFFIVLSFRKMKRSKSRENILDVEESFDSSKTQGGRHASPERVEEGCIGGGGGVGGASPSLVAHAPRLAHAALLPHLDHACEGLHARLPLGDQRYLPLHAHVGPAKTKTTQGSVKGGKFEY